MLTIRKEQMAVFAEAMIKDFEGRMLAHLREHFPRQYDSAGESEMREMIRYGIGRAATYDIREERDVCKYIDLMVVLGRDFDREVQWARALLIIHRLESPGYRVQRLCEEALIALGNQSREAGETNV